jgi:hypothetical protein
MHISPEGKLGLLLGLIALAGAGAIMVAPDHTEIGWLLIAIAAIGGMALAWHHFSKPIPVANGSAPKGAKLITVGLILFFVGASVAITGLVITFIGTNQRAATTVAKGPAAITTPTEKKDQVFVPQEVTPSPSASNPVLIEPPQSYRKNSDGSQRIFIRVLPHEMSAIFEGRTANQAMALVAPYLHKWIAISAIVNNAKTYPDGTTSIHFISVTNQTTVTVTVAEFKEKWRENLNAINKGDTIKVLCRISKIEQSIVNMDSCELFE